VEVSREKGFHLDLEDYLTGLLHMASELVRNSSMRYFISEIKYNLKFCRPGLLPTVLPLETMIGLWKFQNSCLNSMLAFGC